MALSRRDLIQSGLLVPALGQLESRSAMAATAAPAVWIIDEQMPDSGLVAAAARAGSATVHGFSSDPGRLWFNDLAPQLRSAPISIGGYTSASTLFCLHYLAREHGIRLAAVGQGPITPRAIAMDDQVSIDLRNPCFSDPRAAHTWLMLPRRT
jgi:hypothetical protein